MFYIHRFPLIKKICTSSRIFETLPYLKYLSQEAETFTKYYSHLVHSKNALFQKLRLCKLTVLHTGGFCKKLEKAHGRCGINGLLCLVYCICNMTIGGIHAKIQPEPKGVAKGGVLGNSRGLYFTVYPNSTYNTDVYWLPQEGNTERVDSLQCPCS